MPASPKRRALRAQAHATPRSDFVADVKGITVKLTRTGHHLVLLLPNGHTLSLPLDSTPERKAKTFDLMAHILAAQRDLEKASRPATLGTEPSPIQYLVDAWLGGDNKAKRLLERGGHKAFDADAALDQLLGA